MVENAKLGLKNSASSCGIQDLPPFSYNDKGLLWSVLLPREVADEKNGCSVAHRMSEVAQDDVQLPIYVTNGRAVLQGAHQGSSFEAADQLA